MQFNSQFHLFRFTFLLEQELKITPLSPDSHILTDGSHRTKLHAAFSIYFIENSLSLASYPNVTNMQTKVPVLAMKLRRKERSRKTYELRNAIFVFRNQER